MKRIMSLILALLFLAVALPLSVMAETKDVTMTHILAVDGSSDITVNSGDVITVVYSLSPEFSNGTKSAPTEASQNQITFDKDFFEFVEKSNVSIQDYITPSLNTNIDGTFMIYFNSSTSKTYRKATELGSFQLKVTAKSGTGYVRNGTYSVSDNTTPKPVQYPCAVVDLKVTIGGSGNLEKETTPSATFTATGNSTGTLTNVTAGMKYSTDGGTSWTDVPAASTSVDLTGLSACTIKVVKKGNGTTTSDSDAQTITVTKAETPTTVGKTDCTTISNNDGTLTNVTDKMEYKKSDASVWIDITGTTVTGLANGTYDVRVQANGTVLASGAQSVTIGEYTPDALTGTASITGTAKYNETLTATLTDTNNTGNLSYQWKRDGVDISGAKGNTYTTVADDVGKAITVTISSDVQTGSQTSSSVTVAKADAKTIADQTASQKYTVETEQTKTLADLMPDDAGTLTYTGGTESKTGTVTISSWSVDSTTGVVSYKLTGGAKDATVTLPVTISSTNYADSVVKVVITLTDKETVTLSGAVVENKSYDGDPVTVKTYPVGKIDAEQKISSDAANWTVTYYKKTGDTSWSTALASAPTDVGEYKAVFDVPETNPEYKSAEAQTVTFAITKAAVDGTVLAKLTAYNAPYDASAHNAVAGTTDAALSGYTLSYSTTSATEGFGSSIPQVTAVSDSKDVWVKVSDNNHESVVKLEAKVTKADNTLTITAPTGITYGDATVAGTVASQTFGAPADVTYTFSDTENGTYAAWDASNAAGTWYVKGTIAAADNYNAVTSEAVEFTVAAKAISGSVSVDKTNPKYGDTLNAVITSVTPEAARSGLTYQWYRGETVISGATSSTYTVGSDDIGSTIKVKVTGSGNYTGDLTSEATSTVAKADAKTIADQTASQKYTVETEQTKTLADLMPDDAGTLSYAKGTEQKTGTVTISSWSVDSTTGVVSYKLTGGAKDATVTLPVTISSTNYADSVVKVVITLTDKDTPVLTANNYTGVYTGDAVSVDSITKSAKFNNTTVPGTWKWDTGTNVTNVADSGEKTLVFTPEDQNTYKEVTKKVTVTINAATPSGEPSYKKITSENKTLKNAEIGIGTITPAGEIKWDLDEGTVVKAGERYNWTFTPGNANYTSMHGSVVLYEKEEADGPLVHMGIIYTSRYENGEVKIGQRIAYPGTRVKIKTTADEGYETGEVTVTDKYGREIKVTQVSEGEYVFTMPVMDVLVKVTFEEAEKAEEPIDTPDEPVIVDGECPRDETCPIEPYTDTKNDYWWHDGIHYCVENGLMNGIEETTFAPNSPLTRGMIVTILWRIEGSPYVNYQMSFKDVEEGKWYSEAIRWAQSTGVVTGYDADSFGPEDNVTREQLAAILYRYAENKGIDVSARSTLNGYIDKDEISDWALENVKWANAVEMINGRTLTTIAPTENASRAEAAAMIQRFCEKILEK